MSRLRVYTVHINPSLPHPYEEAEFIEEGFNFRAFVFSTFGLWALYHRLWLPFVFLFIFNGFLFSLSTADSNSIGMFAVQIGVNVIIGYLANDWLRGKLKRKGFIIADIVTGDSLISAEQRFFDRYFAIKNIAPFIA